MLKLNKVASEHGVDCEILLKWTLTDASDVAVASYHILSELFAHNKNLNAIDKDFTILCPTNNVSIGLGVALLCSEQGYQPPIIILTKNKVSPQDVNLILSLGAKVIRCPTDKTGNNPACCPNKMCTTLLNFRSKSWNLDFRKELKNSALHCNSKAYEMLEQCLKNADIIVSEWESALVLQGMVAEMECTQGKCKVVAVQTDTRKTEDELQSFYNCSEAEGYNMARKLTRDEGIICGCLGGALVSCAIKAAIDNGIQKNKAARVVVLFPGGLVQGEKMFLGDRWMINSNFWPECEMECSHYWWWDLPLSIIGMKEAVVAHPKLSVKKALDIMDKCRVDRMLITSQDSEQYPTKSSPKAVLSRAAILEHIKKEESRLLDITVRMDQKGIDLNSLPVLEIPGDFNVTTIAVSAKLKDVAEAFTKNHYLIVVQDENKLLCTHNTTASTVQNVVGIVSPVDVLKYKKSAMEEHWKRFGMVMKG